MKVHGCIQRETKMVTRLEVLSCEEPPEGSGLVWFGGDWRAISLLCNSFLRGEGEREVLSSFPWDPVIEHVGMIQNLSLGLTGH